MFQAHIYSITQNKTSNTATISATTKNNISHYGELNMKLEEKQVTAVTINIERENIIIVAIYCRSTGKAT